MNATKVNEKVFNVSNFANEVKVLNAKRNEFVKSEIERQQGVKDGLKDVTAEKAAEISATLVLLNAKTAKEKAIAAYKAAENDYLLNVNEDYKTAQANLILRAVMDFAETKEDCLPFIQWVNANGKTATTSPIDTPNRLESFLKALYDNYIKGRIQARKTKAEKEKEKEIQNETFASLASAPTETLDEMIARLQAEKARRQAENN